MSISQRLSFALLLTPLVLAGCAKDNDITAVGGSIGQQVQRTNCPAVGVPAYTGDVTLFNPPASRDARAIDVVANITNVRSTCDEANDTAANLTTSVTFTVNARRNDPHGARDVVLPYFAVVMHGGTEVASKSTSRVAIHFDDGKLLASSTGQATAAVARADATLPDAVRAKLNRKRKSSDEDASVDPMTDPQVRSALAKASFEVLVGFQLGQDALAYNATR